MLRTTSSLLAALVLLAASPALAEVPSLLGIDGWVADAAGDGLQGDHDVDFAIYDQETGGSPLFSSSRVLTFEDGSFTAYLGEVVPLDLTLFEDNADLWIGVSINSDPEMQPRTRLSTAPFAATAGYAEFAADADLLEGSAASDFRYAADPIDYADLVNVPSETDPLFTAHDAAAVTASSIADWDAAYGWGDHAAAGYLTEFTEADPLFTSHDAAAVTAAGISQWDAAYAWGDHAAAGYLTGFTETDGSTTNELNTNFALNGTTLSITDAGGTQTVNLSGLEPTFIDPENGNTSVTLTGSDAQYPDTGVALRPLTNPNVGEPIFRVLSASGSERLRVEHDGALSTSNTLNVEGTAASSFAGPLDVNGTGTSTFAGPLDVNGTGTSTFAGPLEVNGLLRAQAGSSASAGITFDENPGGGAGDIASIKYYALSTGVTRLQLAVANDLSETISLRVSGKDTLLVGMDEIGVQAAMAQTGCPLGFTLVNGVCFEWDTAWGNQTFNDAQATCHAINARVCTYRDTLLSWGSGASHQLAKNGDWLGDFIADDRVLDVNNNSNKGNFEGEEDKNNTNEFLCCVTPY